MDIKAVIFVPALAGCVIVGFVFLLFAANYYLTILESTGVGARDVTWFNEPVVDNAPKLAYLAWLVGLWLGPAYFLGRTLATSTDPVWLKLAIPIAFFWLAFPVSQLSSLSASTIWLPLVPDIFARLLQKPLVVLEFLVLSALVLALFGVGFKWAFLTADEWTLLFLGSPLVALSWFLYARLIGRLAFTLRFTKSLFPARRKPKPEEKPAEAPVVYVVAQPRDLPPIVTPDEGELHGYDLLMDESPRPRKRLKAEAVEVADESPAPPKKPAAEEGYTFAADETTVPSKKSERTSTGYSIDAEERYTFDRSSDEVVAKSPQSKPPEKKPVRPRPEPRPEPKEPRPEPREARSEAKSAPEPRGTGHDDDDAAAYDVHRAEAAARDVIPESLLKPREDELALLRRDDLPKPAKRIWSADLLAFLFQQETVMAFIIASGLCCAAGMFVRIARAFNPVSGGDAD